MKNVDVGKDILMLHTKYIAGRENLTPSGKQRLRLDEVYQISEAVLHAPRIGRIGTGRKRSNELIAIPRELLMYLIDEIHFGICVCDMLKYELSYRIDTSESTDAEMPQ